MSGSNHFNASFQSGAQRGAHSTIGVSRHRPTPKPLAQDDKAIENAVKGAIATLQRDFPNAPSELIGALQMLARPRQSMLQNQMIEERCQRALASLRGEYPNTPVQALNEHIYEAVQRGRAQLISMRASK